MELVVWIVEALDPILVLNLILAERDFSTYIFQSTSLPLEYMLFSMFIESAEFSRMHFLGHNTLHFQCVNSQQFYLPFNFFYADSQLLHLPLDFGIVLFSDIKFPSTLNHLSKI